MKKFLCEGIVFDLDGTLIDSLPDVLLNLNATLSSYDCPNITMRTLRRIVGHGVHHMVQGAFAEVREPLPDTEVDRAIEAYLTTYANNPVQETIVYPSVRKCLADFRKAGLHLGICTNKPSGISNLVLKALYLDKHFDAVLCGDSVSARKPHGDHVLATLAEMGVSPRSAIMVGDSEVDVVAGKRAGLPVVLVSYGYSSGTAREREADAVIDDFAMLARVVDSRRTRAMHAEKPLP